MTNKELKHYDNLSDDEIRANIKYAEDAIKSNEIIINLLLDKIELYNEILSYRHGKINNT